MPKVRSELQRGGVTNGCPLVDGLALIWHEGTFGLRVQRARAAGQPQRIDDAGGGLGGRMFHM